MVLSILGLLLLFVALLLCVGGLVSAYFDDNLFHCLGLAALLLWTASEIRLVVLTGHVAPRELWLYVGLVSFGLGTALRTWLYARQRGCPA